MAFQIRPVFLLGYSLQLNDKGKLVFPAITYIIPDEIYIIHT